PAVRDGVADLDLGVARTGPVLLLLRGGRPGRQRQAEGGPDDAVLDCHGGSFQGVVRRGVPPLVPRLRKRAKRTRARRNAPATPVNGALTLKASDLFRLLSMPRVVAAIGWLRMAISARPTRPVSRFQPITNMINVTSSVRRYSQRSALSARPNDSGTGGSGW